MLEDRDLDLGTSGPLLLPDQTGSAHPHLVLGAGKEGIAYLVDRDNMGHFNPADNSQIVQTINISPNKVFGTPAFWQNNIYFQAVRDVLKAFALSGGLLSTTPTSEGTTVFGYPGGFPAVSANGSTDGIVWVLDNSASATHGPAILHAYDANNVASELWNSSQAANLRDQAGSAVKFTVPTITNGRVYVGTQNEITVFGLHLSSDATVHVNPTSVDLFASQSQQFTATVTGASNTNVTWSMTPAVGTLSPTGLYTAPSSITTPQTVYITATSQADGTRFATVTVNLQVSPDTFVPIRVHAGGGAYTDVAGHLWSADSNFSGGDLYSVSDPIANTSDPTLYRSERWGAFSYNFSVPNGSYNVTLKFAEIYWSSAGQRVFHVSINGTQALTNFDIVALAGAPFTALERTFPVTVTNGAINIQFISGVADNPKVSAIEILSQSGVTLQVSPPLVDLFASQSQQFTATVTETTSTQCNLVDESHGRHSLAYRSVYGAFLQQPLVRAARG